MKVDILPTLPIIRILGWALLNSLWQGTAVTVLLVGALKLLPNTLANARYAISCLALLLLLLLPVSTALKLGVAPHDQNMIAQETLNYLSTSTELASSSKTARRNIDQAGLGTPVLRSLQSQFERQIEPILSWLFLAWFTGVVVLSARLVGGWAHVQRLKRSGTRPASVKWQEKTAELSARVRVTLPVRLLESTLVRAPAVIGRFRPVILIPASALIGLSSPQLEAIIVHELAHIRRYDYSVNLLQTVVETLLFYHPAAWWVSRQIRIEREHACDDLAVSVCGDRLMYARALTNVERLRKVSAPQLSMAANGSDLLSRIRRLVEPPSRCSGQFSRPLATIILLTTVVSVGALTRTSLFLTSTAPITSRQVLDQQESTAVSEQLSDVTKSNNKTDVGNSRDDLSGDESRKSNLWKPVPSANDASVSFASLRSVRELPDNKNRRSSEPLALQKQATEPKSDTETETREQENYKVRAELSRATNTNAVDDPTIDSPKDTLQGNDSAARARARQELKRRARRDAIKGVYDSVMETNRQVNEMSDRLMKKAVQDALQVP